MLISIPMPPYYRRPQGENKYLNLKLFIQKMLYLLLCRRGRHFIRSYHDPANSEFRRGTIKIMRANELLVLRAAAASSQLLVCSSSLTVVMDIRLLHPSDLPHVQHANITNLPENYFMKVIGLKSLPCSANLQIPTQIVLPLPCPIMAPALLRRSRRLTA